MPLMLLQEMQDGKQIKKEMLKAVKEQIRMKIMNFYSQKTLEPKGNHTLLLKVLTFLN